MLSETLPLTLSAIELHDSDHHLYNVPQKSSLTFIYIGHKSDSLHLFSSKFKSGVFTESFKEAKELIETLIFPDHSLLPDSIIIDLPLNKLQLDDFCSGLKEKSSLAQIPVIYNDKYLDLPALNYLRQADLIDDIFNINSWEINFSSKISFLKNIKRQQSVLYVSRKGKNGMAETKPMFLKRLFDLVVSSVLIILCIPIFIFIAILIKLESRGPVFYTSLRAGRGFKVFDFYKFRTMEVDADKNIEAFEHLNQYEKNDKGIKFLKIYNDPRVTKLGRLLRNTSLDELPQLLNVIKGDMSLVGNRPLPIYEATTLTTDVCVERFMAPAGITGLWQITKRSNLDMSAEERIDLDISYARKSSFLYDMWIILQTPGALLQKANV